QTTRSSRQTTPRAHPFQKLIALFFRVRDERYTLCFFGFFRSPATATSTPTRGVGVLRHSCIPCSGKSTGHRGHTRRPMKTLRRHLSLLVVGALVPLIALAVALTVLMVRDARSTAEEALHQNAWLLSRALDGELLRSLTAMQALAQNDSLRRGDLAAFYNEALHARDSLDIWDNVILVSPRGEHLFNLLRPYG